MIYSSVNDNLMRLEIMHSVAQSYYEATHHSDFREKLKTYGEMFPFEGTQYENMQKESCIVGMVMVWSVVTIESLVNHCLAETINNKISAKMAIEYPSLVTDKLNVAKSQKSELSKKLAILSDDDKNNREILSLADELSGIRNRIVHDKPFDLIDFGDGEVEIIHFNSRNYSSENIDTMYESLDDFNKKCEHLKNYLRSIVNTSSIEFENISFTALAK
ncbi:hypothetical protein HF290_13795 [Acidithiobacillus ferrooxidans]|jgi:hypothetical protein|uniref:hypothetical protein n=1 Tax=Acidithiobacillus ferrooxidans TaxID=920 RepID=UPI001C076D13|nr:hypothetical protein [Acidithiobacillus ferrooxidans]MBU2861430.1 hypothetical protein [Acidithiobacillus ferrooxidans]